MSPDNSKIDFDRLQKTTEIHIRQHLQSALDLAELLELPPTDRAKFTALILEAFELLPKKE